MLHRILRRTFIYLFTILLIIYSSYYQKHMLLAIVKLSYLNMHYRYHLFTCTTPYCGHLQSTARLPIYLIEVGLPYDGRCALAWLRFVIQ